MLKSYAHAISDENGFIDAAVFAAMVINYEIEREMEIEEGVEFDHN